VNPSKRIVLYWRMPERFFNLSYDPSYSILLQDSSSSGASNSDDLNLFLIIAPVALVSIALFLLVAFVLFFSYQYYREHVRRQNLSRASKKWIDSNPLPRASHSALKMDNLTVSDFSNESSESESFDNSL